MGDHFFALLSAETEKPPRRFAFFERRQTRCALLVPDLADLFGKPR